MWGISRSSAVGAMMAMPFAAWALGSAAWSLGGRVWPLGDGAWSGDARDPALLADAITLACAAVGAGVAAYLALSALASLAWSVRGARPRVFGPAPWRAVVATALGVGMGAGVGLPAAAAALPPPSPAWSVAAPADAADENAAPVSIGFAAAPVVEDDLEAPASSPPQVVSLEASSPPPVAAASAYVVQPGDSLWLITAALLGDDATDAEIAAAWPGLYRANAAAIGADPDLIHPGLALSIPNGFGA